MQKKNPMTFNTFALWVIFVFVSKRARFLKMEKAMYIKKCAYVLYVCMYVQYRSQLFGMGGQDPQMYRQKQKIHVHATCVPLRNVYILRSQNTSAYIQTMRFFFLLLMVWRYIKTVCRQNTDTEVFHILKDLLFLSILCRCK